FCSQSSRPWFISIFSFMALTATQHQQLKDLIALRQWDEAEALWLDLTEQIPDEPEFLLLLVKDFADAGQIELAGEMASFIAPNLKSSGKLHEWLYALKLQAAAKSTDKILRAEILEAYRQCYDSDPL